MTDWNSPDADPLADIRSLAASMPEAPAPNVIHLNARAGVIFAASAAAHRLIPGGGILAGIKRRIMRWALELYFSNELKPHKYAIPEFVRPSHPADAEAARRILSSLMATGETTRSQLAVAADVPPYQVTRIVADLRRRFLVECPGPNLVRLIPQRPEDADPA